MPQISGGEGQGGGRGGGGEAVGAVKPALSKVRPNDSSWKICFDFAFLLGKNGQTRSTFSCQPLEWRLALVIFGGESSPHSGRGGGGDQAWVVDIIDRLPNQNNQHLSQVSKAVL